MENTFILKEKYTMPKSKKIVLSLPEQAYSLYMRFLRESLLTPSAFFIALLVEKEKGIVERRPVGRQPKKVETQKEKEARWDIERAEPKTIPHPDQTWYAGVMLNRFELEKWSDDVDFLYGSGNEGHGSDLAGYMPKEERTG